MNPQVRALLPASTFTTLPISGNDSTDVRGGTGSFNVAATSLPGQQLTAFQRGLANFVGDLPKVPLNLAANTIEFGVNLLNAELPGDPAFMPFMNFSKVPYNSPVSSYVEFGAGLFVGRSFSSVSEAVEAGEGIRSTGTKIGANSVVTIETNALQRIAANNLDNSASVARMARIDELATTNINRLMTRDLSNSNYVYRAVSADMIDIYEAQGAISDRGGSSTFFSLDVGATPGEHMLGAQMPSPSQVMLRMPTSEIVGATVPRQKWDSSTIGREYFTNSYPNWGQGGYRQFVGTTNNFPKDWIVTGWGK